MSKERDFHKIIENQNEEEKRKIWEKIESLYNTDCDNNVVLQGSVLALSKNKQFYLKIFIPIGAVVLAICVILLSILLRKKPNPIVIRYCDKSEYYDIETNITIKQYALDNGKQLLYFDFYEDASYLADRQFRLKDTDEVICLNEELLDANDAYINLYITNNKTEIDLLNPIVRICNQSTSVKNVQVHWGYDDVSASYAYFEYEKYIYYISVEDVNDSTYVLDLTNSLIK